MMKEWLKDPAAEVFLWDLKERQLGAMNALLLADTGDPSTMSALRITQGRQTVIDYIEGCMELANAPNKEEEYYGDE